MTFEFSCDACQKQYALPYERVRGRVLKVRCKQCQHLMVVRDPQRAQVTPTGTSEPQTMGAQTLFNLQAIPSREEEEARLSAHLRPPATLPTGTPSLPPPPTPSSVASSSPSVEQAYESSEADTDASSGEERIPAQISKTYRSEHSVKVEVPKPTDEWAQEVAADLDRPITREIKIDQLQGVRSSVDFRPAHIRYMPLLLGLITVAGLALLIIPNLSSPPSTPKRAQEKPAKEMLVTLNQTAILQAQEKTSTKPKGTTANPAQTAVISAEGSGALTSSSTSLTQTKSEPATGAQPSTLPGPTSPSNLSVKAGDAKPKHSSRPAKRATKAPTKRVRRSASKRPGLPQSSIRQIVQQNTGSLSYCYQKVQKKSSIGPVKTRLSFTVLPNGRTKPGAKLSGKHKNSKLERCISLAVQRWRFPSAEGESEVRYPLNFSPGF